jgi:hypothetical protein
LIGSDRTRFPVAAKTAFATAGAMTGVAGSPGKWGRSDFHNPRFANQQ